jgi:hypothetical protein
MTTSATRLPSNRASKKQMAGTIEKNVSFVLISLCIVLSDMASPADDWENDVVVPVAPPIPQQPEFPVLMRNPSSGQQPRQQQTKKAEQQQQQQPGFVPFENDAPALHPLLQEIASSDYNSLLFRVEDKIQRFLQDAQVRQIAINGVSGNNATMVCCLGEHFGLKVTCSTNGSITLSKQPCTRRYPPGLGMLPGGCNSSSPKVKVMMRKDDQQAGSSRFQPRGNDARVQQVAAQRQENKVAACALPARLLLPFSCLIRFRRQNVSRLTTRHGSAFCTG